MRKLKKIIETERLIIRPFELKDIKPSYEMNLDPEVNRYTSDGGIVSHEEIKRRITTNVFGDYEKYGYGRMAVEWKEEGKFIGFTGLKYLEDLQFVDIGYRFMQKYWGKGIATESGKAILKYGFEELKLEKIYGLVLPANTGSVNVLKKLGFNYDKQIMDEEVLIDQYVIENV